MSAIPPKVERATCLVSLWVKTHVSDWVVVKEEILNELDNETRKLFTKRDERTRAIAALNEMELEIVALWKRLTGAELQLNSYRERKGMKWWKPPADWLEE